MNDLSLLNQTGQQGLCEKDLFFFPIFFILAAGSFLLSWLTVHLEEDFLQLGAISCLIHVPSP